MGAINAANIANGNGQLGDTTPNNQPAALNYGYTANNQFLI
jgi:hypothetical protein